MTDKQKVLAEKHGTPEEFEEAVWNTYNALYIDYQETIRAINKYKEEWGSASEDKRTL